MTPAILIIITLACIFEIGRTIGQIQGLGKAKDILLDILKDKDKIIKSYDTKRKSGSTSKHIL